MERGARGIRLTAAGELLVDHAEVILDRLAAAEHELEAMSGLDGGRLRIGAFPSANVTLIPLALTAFDADYPEVCLSLMEETAEPGPLLTAGELDSRWCRTSGRPGRGHRARAADGGSDVPRAARKHPLADKPELSMTDLRDEVWIADGRNGTAAALTRAAERAGFEPRIAFQSTAVARQAGPRGRGCGHHADPDGRAGHGARGHRPAFAGRRRPAPAAFRSPPTSCRYHAPASLPCPQMLRRVAEEHCFACNAWLV